MNFFIVLFSYLVLSFSWVQYSQQAWHLKQTPQVGKISCQPFLSVFLTHFLRCILYSNIILLPGAFIVCAPGVTPQRIQATALIAVPVLKAPIVSHVAMRTVLASQNLVLGYFDPSTHLLPRSGFV